MSEVRSLLRALGRINRAQGWRSMRVRWHPLRLESEVQDPRGRWFWRVVEPETFPGHGDCLAKLARLRALTDSEAVAACRTPAEQGCEPAPARRVVAAAKRWARTRIASPSNDGPRDRSPAARDRVEAALRAAVEALPAAELAYWSGVLMVETPTNRARSTGEGGHVAAATAAINRLAGERLRARAASTTGAGARCGAVGEPDTGAG